MEDENVSQDTHVEENEPVEETEQQCDSGYNSPEAPNLSTRGSVGSVGSISEEEDLATVVDDLDDDFADKLNLLDEEFDAALSDEIDLIILDENNEKDSVSFGKTSTIADIINRTVGNEHADDFDVKIDGRVLPRNITLRDAGLTSGTKVRVAEREFQIFIRRVDGRSSTMDVRSSSTIQSLKEQFFNTDQVPIHQQRLLYQSHELENTRTCEYYKIRSCCTLEMVYRLRGGF